MLGEASGVMLLAIGFLVLLTTIGLLGRHHRDETPAAPVRQVESLAFLRGWYTLSWLPWRFTAAGTWIGSILALLTWALLLPQTRAAAAIGFITLIFGLEYNLEAFWRGCQLRRPVTIVVGLISSLLCLAGMGLHFGIMLGHELPF